MTTLGQKVARSRVLHSRVQNCNTKYINLCQFYFEFEFQKWGTKTTETKSREKKTTTVSLNKLRVCISFKNMGI